MKNNFLIGTLQFFLVIAFLAGALVVSNLLSGIVKEPDLKPSSEEYTPTLAVQSIQPVTYKIQFKTNGTVRLGSSIDIVPQISGKIVKIDRNFHSGGSFGKEQVLFQIQEDDLLHDIEQAKAEIAEASARLELQEAEARTSIAEWHLINTEKPPPLIAQTPQLEEKKAALRAARAKLEKAEMNLSRTRFSLPFAGRIMETSLAVGQYVTAGRSYGRAYALDALEIDVPLQDDQLKWIGRSPDPAIKIYSDYKGSRREYEARLKNVDAMVDDKTRLTRIFLKFEESDPDIVPGVFVEARITGEPKNNIWLLPNGAFQDGRMIWIVQEDNLLQPHNPDIIYIGEDYTIVQGDERTITVVTDPAPGLTQGTKIRVRQDASKPPV